MNISEFFIPRRDLCRWAGLFFIVNTLLFIGIGCFYLPILPQDIVLLPLVSVTGNIAVWCFTIAAMIGQMAIIALVAYCITLILICCFPFRWFAFFVAGSQATIIIWLLIADNIVYHQYRFHLLDMAWQILTSGAGSQVLVFSTVEWLLALLITVTLVIMEYSIARLILLKIHSYHLKKYGLGSLFIFCLCLLFSYSLFFHAKSSNVSDENELNYNHLMISATKIIPYYDNVFNRFYAINKIFWKKSVDGGKKKIFHYPLSEINSYPPSSPLNIVMIVIDTWRQDMLNPKITPNISQLARRSWNFKNHYSGGNWTQPGIFSMFYSIPPNYWASVLKQKHGPVIIRQLLKNNYQMSILGSASLLFPAFEKTVFKEVPDLQIETSGNTSAERDIKITEQFQQFIQSRDKNKPFFSFLFYDEVHSWCGSSQPYSKPFQPAIQHCDRLTLTNDTDPNPYLNRYRNSVRFVDGLVGEAVQALEKQHLLKNTIIIITADHGEEFNDERTNHWGHASGFSSAQVKVPLIVYWPKLGAREINYQTSHYDIVPTLLTGVLGSTNALSDYSVGYPLLAETQRPYLIIDGYTDYAVLKDSQVTTIYDDGKYRVQSLDHNTQKNVFNDLNRYLK